MLIQIITGTTREGRFSERVADWVVAHAPAEADVELEVIDLRDYPLPFFDQAAPARTLRDYPNDASALFGRAIDRADGYIWLSAEYNHGYPAVLKNAIDHTFVEWRHKPVSFIGWGNVGGARAIEQLREVAVELEMAPLRHAVHILPDVMIAARKEDGLEVFAPLQQRLDMLFADLLWWTRALYAGRAAHE
jgi:NAD(P)H-dependent FMN reductase